MTNRKKVRYWIGFAGIVATFLVIVFVPLPSIMGSQAGLLRRAFLTLLVCGVFCLWRIFIGPTAADRAAALDILGILILGFCAILGITTGRDWYIDIGIAWALQSFISILALGKYLEGRRFDE
ncbi:MAG: monovalent cation/H+ antiporter complex subunit F [Candidatus Omnitrophota bacterium]